MEYTQPSAWLEQPHEGYVVNAGFSAENTDRLEALLALVTREFGEVVYPMRREGMHITLLYWIAPLVAYDGRDKAQMFAELRDSYDAALTDILSAMQPITVHFEEIRVTPGTIIITGRDDGQFQHIRDTFVERVELPSGTKLPPTIIHSSLARFTGAIDLEPLQAFVAGQSIDFTQTVDRFRLVHTRREPMLEFDVLKDYELPPTA